MVIAAAEASFSSSIEGDGTIANTAVAPPPYLNVDYLPPPQLPPVSPHPILQWILWGEDLLSGLDEATKRSGLYSPIRITSSMRGGDQALNVVLAEEEEEEEQEEDDYVTSNGHPENGTDATADSIQYSSATSTYESVNDAVDDDSGYTATNRNPIWPSFTQAIEEKRSYVNETATISTSLTPSDNQTADHRQQQRQSNATTAAFVKNTSQLSSSPFEKYTFSLFQPDDGSQVDPDGIPNRYLKTYKGDRIKAKTALDATIEWRKSNNINTLLARPYPKYNLCKRTFPMFFVGYDDTDHVVLVQKPGLIDLKLSEANGLTAEDFLDYYIYINEYLWQILSPNANDTMTSIIDLDGLSFSSITKQLIQVSISFCQTMENHYPARSHKTLLINVPRWFGTIYKVISPLLRESTKQKLSIYSKGSKEQQIELNQLLSHHGSSGGDAVVSAMGKSSSSSLPPPLSLMEQNLQDFCLARLKDAGVGMQSIIVV